MGCMYLNEPVTCGNDESKEIMIKWVLCRIVMAMATKLKLVYKSVTPHLRLTLLTLCTSIATNL